MKVPIYHSELAPALDGFVPCTFTSPPPNRKVRLRSTWIEVNAQRITAATSSRPSPAGHFAAENRCNRLLYRAIGLNTDPRQVPYTPKKKRNRSLFIRQHPRILCDLIEEPRFCDDDFLTVFTKKRMSSPTFFAGKPNGAHRECGKSKVPLNRTKILSEPVNMDSQVGLTDAKDSVKQLPDPDTRFLPTGSDGVLLRENIVESANAAVNQSSIKEPHNSRRCHASDTSPQLEITPSQDTLQSSWKVNQSPVPFDDSIVPTGIIGSSIPHASSFAGTDKICADNSSMNDLVSLDCSPGAFYPSAGMTPACTLSPEIERSTPAFMRKSETQSFLQGSSGVGAHSYTIPSVRTAATTQCLPSMQYASTTLKAGSSVEKRRILSAPINKESLVTISPYPIHSNYVIREKIGQGTWGSVHLATERLTGSERAVKKIPKKFTEELGRFRQEINIMKGLDHPHIIRLLEVFEDYSNIYMVIECCRGGELFDKISQCKFFCEASAATLMFQILSSLSYIHRKQIAHRDLKPENFLFLTNSKSSPMKLIDFGLAKRFSARRRMRTKVGTLFYVAPEILSGAYDEKCDLWSAGVILYVLLCGAPPFSGTTDAAILKRVRSGEPMFAESAWRSISATATDLVRRLLAKNPAERLSADAALKHPWFNMFSPVAVRLVRPHSLPAFNAPKRATLGFSSSTREFGVAKRSTLTRANVSAASPVTVAGPSDLETASCCELVVLGIHSPLCPLQQGRESRGLTQAATRKFSEEGCYEGDDASRDATAEKLRIFKNLARNLVPNWRRFARMNLLKRATLKLVVQQLPDADTELPTLREFFLALDIRNDGAITADELLVGLQALQRLDSSERRQHGSDNTLIHLDSYPLSSECGTETSVTGGVAETDVVGIGVPTAGFTETNFAEANSAVSSEKSGTLASSEVYKSQNDPTAGTAVLNELGPIQVRFASPSKWEIYSPSATPAVSPGVDRTNNFLDSQKPLPSENSPSPNSSRPLFDNSKPESSGSHNCAEDRLDFSVAAVRPASSAGFSPQSSLDSVVSSKDSPAQTTESQTSNTVRENGFAEGDYETPTEADLRALVVEVALDGSEAVEYSDFLAASIATCVMNPEISDDRYLKGAFRVFDRDGDGTISRGELKAALGWSDVFAFRSPTVVPHTTDTNDSTATIARRSVDEELKRILRAYDLDGDGAIGIEEFMSVFRHSDGHAGNHEDYCAENATSSSAAPTSEKSQIIS